MRKMTGVLILAAACLPLLGAQENGARPDILGGLLRAFPAESGAARDAAAARLLALGPEAVSALCARLAAPGEADDSLVRFALDAAAVYAGRPGAEAERLGFSRSLVRALAEPRDAENAAFILSLLQRVGREEAVEAAAASLRRPGLAGPASRALAAIGGARAEKALVGALAEASGEAAVSVIQALGRLRSREAVKPLLSLASGEAASLRPAALDALAEIGDPAARSVLETISVTAAAEERERAGARLLRFAERLSETNHRREAEALCRAFVGNYSAPAESGIRAAALSLLVEMLGPGALTDLKAAAVSPDRAFRAAALRLVEDLKDGWEAPYWIGLLSLVSPEPQADIIGLLGRREEKSALTAVRGLLSSGEAEVRIAAAGALARIGGERAIEDLAPLFAGAEEREAQALKEAYLALPASAAVTRAAALLGGGAVSIPARTALIELLAERRAGERADLVLADAGSGDDRVRSAALAALERVVRGRDAAALADLLAAPRPPSETALLQNAWAASALLVADPEARAETILAVLEKTEGAKRTDLVRPLARVGGRKALAAVIAETKGADPQLQAVALHTLSNWPDQSALPELFSVARSASDRKSRSLALQGISRLVPLAEESEERKLAVLEEAMALAVEPDQKAAVLSGFAALRTSGALAAAARFLDDPGVAGRAAAAVLRIALPGPGSDGLGGEETARVIKKALPFVESAYDRGEAENRAEALLVEAGFVPLFNGKDLAGWKGLVADPPRRAAMSAGELAAAQAEADEDMRKHWRVVEGVLTFDGKGHSLCSAEDFGDFEMYVDWKIEPGGDSGIYLRGSPQVQIWDPAQWPEGSGGLYNNLKNPKDPLVPA
ncbi:MAG: DUF1080 domain-containing protein, partial [Candidatus Aminicenantes bacterium]|nr:DUF1080 domain-containing protein [Candidatus Aminicenantes bacterium]